MPHHTTAPAFRLRAPVVVASLVAGACAVAFASEARAGDHDDLCAALPPHDGVAIEIAFSGLPSAVGRARADAWERCGDAGASTRLKIAVLGPNGGGGGVLATYSILEAGKPPRRGKRAELGAPPITQASVDAVVDHAVAAGLLLARTPDAPALPADDGAVCSALQGVKVGLASTGTTTPATTAEVSARLSARCATVVPLASPSDDAGKQRVDYVVVLDGKGEQMKERVKIGISLVPQFRVQLVAHIAKGAAPAGDVFVDAILVGVDEDRAITAADTMWKRAGARGRPPFAWRAADDVAAWIVKDRAAATHPRPAAAR